MGQRIQIQIQIQINAYLIPSGVTATHARFPMRIVYSQSSKHNTMTIVLRTTQKYQRVNA